MYVLIGQPHHSGVLPSYDTDTLHTSNQLQDKVPTRMTIITKYVYGHTKIFMETQQKFGSKMT